METLVGRRTTSTPESWPQVIITLKKFWIVYTTELLSVPIALSSQEIQLLKRNQFVNNDPV